MNSILPRHSLLILLAVFFSGLALPSPSFAEDFYVAPHGRPDHAGTKDSPWDLESVFAGKKPIPPGSTVYLAGGVYRHPDRSWKSKGYFLFLAGTPENPIEIRPLPGERATLDGGLEVKAECHDVRVRDLEITVSETAGWKRGVTVAGAEPDPRAELPQGGLNILGGERSRFIHLVIHDMPNGVGFWRGAIDAEMHGCLIYNNGTIGPDRYHGPGIYTQNQTGIKRLTDNILFANYSTTIQAYGSENAWVDGFHIEGNISFAPLKASGRQQILVGGGRPSRDITILNNLLYEVLLQIGYTAPHNENAIVKGNRIVNAGFSINNYRQVVQEDNQVFGPQAPRPDRPADVYLRPSSYDPRRAHLAIFNWRKAPAVEINLTSFLKKGDRYRIQNALDFYGAPVAAGVYDGTLVSLPVPAEDRTGNGEFCAYVVFSRPAGRE